MGQALIDMKGKRVAKLFLARPTISVDEQLGFMPGNMEEKLGVWAGAFKDCLGDLTYASLEDFDTELVAVGMLRGRTIKNAILIVDEAQNLTYNQLKCIVTRMGKNAKIILCGDPRQSDITSKTHWRRCSLQISSLSVPLTPYRCPCMSYHGVCFNFI